MSIHLVTCAAAVPLKPSEKLVLLCLAENANARDSKAFPGLSALMTWSGVSRARVFEILRVLQELRLIEQVGAGHRGRAAEFAVFPYGCCEAHGKESDASDPIEAVESPTSQTLSAGKGPVEDPERVQFRPGKGPTDWTPTKNPPSTSPRSFSPDVPDRRDVASELHEAVSA